MASYLNHPCREVFTGEPEDEIVRLRECTVIGRDDDDFDDFVLVRMPKRAMRSADDSQRYRLRLDQPVCIESEPRDTGTLYLVCVGYSTPVSVDAAFSDKRAADEHSARQRRKYTSPHPVRVGRRVAGKWVTL